MKFKYIVTNLLLILFIINIITTSSVKSEETIIEVTVYFTWMNTDGTWNEWIKCTNENKDILYSLNLSINQPIKCKMILACYAATHIGFQIYEPQKSVMEGNYSYDVLQGNKHYQIVDCGNVDKDTRIEYIWVLKANGNYTEIDSPINAYWQAQLENGTILNGHQGFANPFIKNESWNGIEYEPDSDPNVGKIITTSIDQNDKKTPGFKITILITAIILLLIVTRRHN